MLDALVIENPVAPNRDEARLRAALTSHFGADAFRIVPTKRAASCEDDLEREMRHAAARGCGLVIAAGGDGTVSLVSGVLARLGEAGRAPALAIVPCGTANILARELGIPLALDEALALAAARPRTNAIDGIAIRGRLVLTQVGIGPDAYMIRDTKRGAKHRFKRFSYVAAFLPRVLGHRSRRFHLKVDGRSQQVRAWQVLVANAATLGVRPFTWGPGIDPRDGHLDLCVLRVQRRRDLMRLAWLLLTGNHGDGAITRFLRVERCASIESHPASLIQGDGEMLGSTPVDLAVVPRAVAVVVPSDGVSERYSSTAPHGRDKASEPRPSEGWGGRWKQWRRVLGALDTRAFLAINRLRGGVIVDRLLLFSSRISRWGEVWVAVALAAALLDRARLADLPLRVVPPLWIAMLTVNHPIKWAFKRRRPFLVHERARLIGRRPLDTSFPSGHTAAAFAGAFLLGTHLPGPAPHFWLYALIVGFSRVYLGVHFPADVVAGAFVGVGFAVLYGRLWTLFLTGN